jgi:hypothetical protein
MIGVTFCRFFRHEAADSHLYELVLNGQEPEIEGAGEDLTSVIPDIHFPEPAAVV